LSKTREGVITSWNRGAQQMFGYTAEKIVGHSILTLIPAEGGDRLRRPVDGNAVGGGSGEACWRKFLSLCPAKVRGVA